MLFSKLQAKSMQTDCCYRACQGHHILTRNSSPMISFVSVSAEAKPEEVRKQHRRTRQNKSIGNITNKIQEKKKVWEKGLKKNEIKLIKYYRKWNTDFILIRNRSITFTSFCRDALFLPNDSMTHFGATTIYVILFLNISWKKPGYEWHKPQLYNSDQFLELAK